MRAAILFVCLGNICRSPTAEAVCRAQLAKRGWQHAVQVDSAGTASWHIGKAPDSRSIAAGSRRGYDLAALRARQVEAEDFSRFDYILAMDADNLAQLQRLCPQDYRGELRLLTSYLSDGGDYEVPDPYYGGADGFERVLDLLERACHALLDQLGSAMSAEHA